MIVRNIIGGSHTSVTGSTASDIYINPNGGPMAGSVRYVNSNFEVYDGSMWRTIGSSYVSVNLNENAIKAIDWVFKKMEEENSIQEIARTRPAVSAAYENYIRASDQLKTTIILSNDEQSAS